MLKKLFFIILGLIICGLVYAYFAIYPKLEVLSSYAAKRVCSCTFIADRKLPDILDQDLGKSPFGIVKSKIDYDTKTAYSSVYGLQNKKAVYRDGLGCVLIHGKDDYQIKARNFHAVNEIENDTLSYPYGNRMIVDRVQGVNYDKITLAGNALFDPNGSIENLKTLAALIIYKDTVLYERYAQGYDPNTEILGWSMTKSIMNAWVGMMVKDGRVSLEDNHLFPEWENDDRANITLNDLMHMDSGLEWEEVYDEISPATKMLFTADDITTIPKAQPLSERPGTYWEYSSGTSNLIAAYLRNKYNSHDDYLNYPHARIFGPLHMHETTMEVDEAGNYIGSSYTYATARDWARFGLLYLKNGWWNGNQLLPDGWVDYSKAPTKASNGAYAAQFWSNSNHNYYADAPEDMYSMNGFEGQRVCIIPSKDLVIVRLGLNEHIDLNSFISEVCKAIPYEY